MIDRIIADYERRRDSARIDLSKATRNRTVVVFRHNKDTYDKLIKRLRTQIREYDKYIEYLGSVKNDKVRATARIECKRQNRKEK